MVYKASNEITWEPFNPRLQYKRKKYNDELCTAMVSMIHTSGPLTEVLDDITSINAAEYIKERYSDCEFALDVRIFKLHQQQDAEMKKQIKKEFNNDPHSTHFTTKMVEGVDLIHTQDKILVPSTLKSCVLD